MCSTALKPVPKSPTLKARGNRLSHTRRCPRSRLSCTHIRTDIMQLYCSAILLVTIKTSVNLDTAYTAT